MAACRFLERKKAHYNLKYRWARPFAQVICHPKQFSKNIQTVIALLLVFFKSFYLYCVWILQDNRALNTAFFLARDTGLDHFSTLLLFSLEILELVSLGALYSNSSLWNLLNSSGDTERRAMPQEANTGQFLHSSLVTSVNFRRTKPLHFILAHKVQKEHKRNKTQRTLFW